MYIKPLLLLLSIDLGLLAIVLTIRFFLYPLYKLNKEKKKHLLDMQKTIEIKVIKPSVSKHQEIILKE